MNRHTKHLKTRSWRNLGFAPLVVGSLALALLLSSGTVFAQDVIENDQSDYQGQALMEYWTPERMRNAIPMDMAGAPEPGAKASMAEEAALPEDAKPAYAPGWKPGSGPQPDPLTGIEITPDHPLHAVATGDALPQTQAPFSPPSTPTSYNHYSPFDRWTWYGRYTTWPTSTIGKLFFTKPNVGNYVCSASVIGRRVIATAAHCLRDSSGFFENWLFCPSYNKNGVNPATGCWGWTYGRVSQAWANNEATDRDYACIVTSPTNSTTGKPVGNVTGWTGRAWNWRTKQHTTAWGYPSASPFPGYHIITSASPEWYEVNMTSGDGLVSKYIGSDQTGGCSGGPWWFSIRHPRSEYPDVDGSHGTDPHQMGGPYINGVNSHRRCTKAGCPKGSVFLSEIGSPQFRGTAGDTDESEDIFAGCYAND